tara:strand:- start:145 stop:540 length:396 start_codon:yes stop_codon:yes gene_type:complete
MNKLLTEIHLLMERTDFQYVATELVKNYNLKSKVKFGTFGKDKGGYNWDDDVINLQKSYPNVDDFIITVLHEIHHAIQVDKYGRKKFLKKYAQAGNMAALDGKDRYLANKWEKKAENWAQQEYRRKWKGKF